MFVVDTNILIYSVDKNCPEHSVCYDLLAQWRMDHLPWYVTWPILYEFMRVSTHPRVFTKPLKLEQAWKFIQALLTSPGLKVLSEGPSHAEIADITLKEIGGIRGNLLHDARTAIVMREHGIKRIYTRNTNFHRFPFLEVIDPFN